MLNATATRILLLALATAANAGSALADPVPIERRIAHPSGAALVVKTIDLRAASIVLSVTIANPGDREIRLNRARSFVLDDGARGIHHLNPPADNPELRVPARAQLDGDLVFIGPLAPSVRQLTLSSKPEIGTSDQPRDNAPVSGATLPVEEQGGTSDVHQADHPDGVALRVRSILTTGAACVVSLLATNGSDRTIVLNQNGSLALTDGHGVSAPAKAPTDNRELVVPSGDRLDADLVFDCRSLDTSGPLTLSTNRSTVGTANKPDDSVPVFTVRAAVGRWADEVPPASSRSAVAPIAWSHLAEPAATVAAAPPAGPNAATVPPTPPPAATSPQSTGLLPAGGLDPTRQEARSTARPPGPVPPNAPAQRAIEQLAAALHVKKTERGLRIALPADALFGSAPSTLDAAADRLLAQLAELIAATDMREVVVTVHPGSAGEDADNEAQSKQRAHAVVAWLERHAPKPQPRFVARGDVGRRPAAPNDNAGDPDSARRRERPWVDVILRRDDLVPNSRSPASPSPGKI